MTRATGAATPRGASVRGVTGVMGRGGSGRNAAIVYAVANTRSDSETEAGDV